MLAHTNVAVQLESSPATGSTRTEVPSAAAGASDADAAYRHVMIDVYMSIAEGVKRRGHPSCVWRLLEFGCGTIIAFTNASKCEGRA